MRLRLVLLGVIAASVLAAEPAITRPDVRDSLETVERDLTGRMHTNEALSTMYVLWRPRGVYLEGYGAVFTLELNLVPMGDVSPFQKAYSDEQKRQLNVRKRQRLEDLTEAAREILVEAAKQLTVVPENEKVALAVTLFHYGWEDMTGLPAQLVVQAPRKALLAGAAGTLGKAELRAQIEEQQF
jgi:hypothetical protein